ncbi:SdpI family protein [Nocardiopsis sp. HUAS JQ3]|uniref:SdpI family protein n=1 Tax=Nocardiopsis sp. HUAS JQ3 TaxID=3061629 RepID=UPI0023AA0E6B|nr:SdpI family protein [Nocardiopsis sp. HUAS JQ3]WDZ89727.1 SdpI family protein [Nocardiopsis sp. HUAS JQ3]
MPPFLAEAVSDGTEPLTGWTMVLIMAILAVAPAILIASGWLGARGLIRPNLVFGIRTTYTLSDDAWYTVHALAGNWTIASGAVMALSVALTPFFTDDIRLQAAAMLAPVGTGLILLFLGVWRAERIARARAARDTDAP